MSEHRASRLPHEPKRGTGAIGVRAASLGVGGGSKEAGVGPIGPPTARVAFPPPPMNASEFAAPGRRLSDLPTFAIEGQAPGGGEDRR